MAYKVLVAHPGKQHSFHLASALKKNGILFKYITTVYDKKNSLVMRILKRFLDSGNKQRANSRKNLDLSDSEVIQFCEYSGLIEILLARVDRRKKLYSWWHYLTSDRFGKKVAKLAIKNNVDAVVMYDTNALSCFKILKKKAPHIKRIMDSSAANRLFIKGVYKKDMELCPTFAAKLKNEVPELWDGKSIIRFEKEIEYTQFFLVPSLFVKKSFLYSGVSEDKIKVCPYGSNFDLNSEYIAKVPGNKLEAIYVGNVTEMKGIYYLLEAIKQLPKDSFHMTIVGNFDNSSHLFDEYLDFVTFTGRVQHKEVKEMLFKADVFVFASLGEGLSLSVLEALACGLPCIVTEHSGANDAIVEGKNGFVIPIQDISAIVDKLLWFMNNKDKIPQMKKNAVESASNYTWECYNERMFEQIIQILEVK